MQWGAPANQIDDAYQRTSGRGAFDIDDLVVVPCAEVDRLADGFVQFLHEGQGDFAHVDP